MHNHHTHQSENKSENSQNVNNLMCPVMKGTHVNKDEAEQAGLVREYKGKKYYFCCDACLIDFDHNHEAYVQ